MPKVLCRKFSNYFDPKTKIHFTPLLDRSTGCFIGFAQVSRELAAGYAQRDGFEVVSDERYLALTSLPEDPEPEADASGDPLTDAAAVRARKRADKAAEKATQDLQPLQPEADASGDPLTDAPAPDESAATPEPAGDSPTGDDGPPPPPESK